MQNNRAKLFNPFDALKGLQEALRLQEKMFEDKMQISYYLEESLNSKISSLKEKDNVIVKHYHDLEYIETSGIIKKIDLIEKYIYLLNTKISFDDIIDIDKIN